MGTQKKHISKNFRKTRSKKKHGGEPQSQKEKDKFLLDAVKNNDYDKVEYALRNGADVNVRDEDGQTSLILASAAGHTDVVQLLLVNGANVNEKDNDGWTAIQEASSEGHTEIVKMLLARWADVKTRTNDDVTTLHIARDNGHTEIVRLIKERIQLLKKVTDNFKMKEENKFIVESIDQDITYDDVIEGEITINMKRYLEANEEDHIIIVYKSNKKNIDLEYFATTRTIILNAIKDDNNIFYGCNKVIIPPPYVPRKEDYDNEISYLKLNKIGLVGTASEYCEFSTLLEYEDHQFFAVKSLNVKYPSFVSKNVIGSNPNVTSASHCQGGDAASVSTFVLAFPRDKVYKSFKVLPAYSQTQLGGKKRSKSKKQTKKRAPKKRT